MNDSLEKATDTTKALAAATESLFSALGADQGQLDKALKKLESYSKQLTTAQNTTSQLGAALNTSNKQLQAKTAESQH